MAWDAKREVPWGRLFREWLVYATVMVLVFVVFLRDTVTGGSILGLAASFPMYLGFGYVLAKFGYQRKTLKGLRSEIPTRRTLESSPTQQQRDRPSPTRRTSTGPSQHRPANKPKRR